ncbi:MAG: antibiotic biosynthesis monooxygenase [Proteobacteria bacterium]|nr:antibiotic biosynthesis monooxygenase [Pseudomonadota bacterium]
MSVPAIVFVTLTPKEAAAQAFLETMRPMITATRDEPGNEVYDLYGDDKGSFHLFERYVDDDALRAHRSSDHFRRLQTSLADILVGERTIQVLTELDVVH